MGSVLLLLKLEGKQRLSHVYSDEQREKLILFCFERILKVLEGFKIFVITPDDISGDFDIVRDEWEDLNKSIRKAREKIGDDMLILPCDLPFVEREDIDRLIGEKVRIVPSQNGGTNALFLPAEVDTETQFGENSFERHLETLKSGRIEYEVYESDKFRDVDTEEDILWALEHRRDSEFSKFVREELNGIE